MPDELAGVVVPAFQRYSMQPFAGEGLAVGDGELAAVVPAAPSRLRVVEAFAEEGWRGVADRLGSGGCGLAGCENGQFVDWS